VPESLVVLVEELAAIELDVVVHGKPIFVFHLVPVLLELPLIKLLAENARLVGVSVLPLSLFFLQAGLLESLADRLHWLLRGRASSTSLSSWKASLRV